jgi:hypothetical protein
MGEMLPVQNLISSNQVLVLRRKTREKSRRCLLWVWVMRNDTLQKFDNQLSTAHSPTKVLLSP